MSNQPHSALNMAQSGPGRQGCFGGLLRRAYDYRIALVIALAVGLRLAVVIAFPAVFAWDQTGTVHGSDLYDKLAQNLIQTGVYGYTPGIPDASVPPLYAFTVAVVYSIFGRGAWPIIIFHIGLDVFSILCVMAIGRRLFAGRGDGRRPTGDQVATLAGLLYACYPYLIFQNLTLIDTPLFMACLNGFVLALLLVREQDRLDGRTAAYIALAGVALGLGLLARPIMALIGPFAALWFLFRLNLRQMLLRLIPVALIGLLVVLPWLARTFSVYETVIPIANNGGMNFWFGNSRYTIPFLEAGYHPQWATPDTPIDPNDRVANGQYMAESMAFLRAHPDQIPMLLWVKLLAYWSIDVYPSQNPGAGVRMVLGPDGQVSAQLSGLDAGDPVAAYSQPLFDRLGRIVHILYFGPLFLLALLGIVLSARAWRSVALLWFIQIAMTVMYVVFIPATRYRAPTDPLLFLFSAYALVALLTRLGRPVPQPAPTVQPSNR